MALDGVTVLDLTQQLPGPYATLLLRQLGARVIKVEPPAGDPSREIDPRLFSIVNAGKESVVLDLKTGDGRGALAALARESAVFVEGFRPGVADRLGAGYHEIARLRPDVVYCSISGFGTTGPYRDVPGHDLNYLGLAGGVDPDEFGGPRPGTGVPLVDLGTGTVAALAIVAALARGGRRQLDIAMFDTALAWSAMKVPPQSGCEPAYTVVRASDGRALSIAAMEDKFWRGLCVALGWDDWRSAGVLETYAARRQRAAEIDGRLRATLATRPAAEWLDLFRRHDVPAAPVLDQHEVAAEPQAVARGLFDDGRPLTPLPWDGAETLPPAPELDADRAAVLGRLSM
jgi:crotonobetainyl-CoA:carnitine CoA-transferase CaiB-like acyl-CoA transferase